jgi:hypothetical protein
VIDTFACLQFLTSLSFQICYVSNIQAFPSSLKHLDISNTIGD